MRNAKLKTFLLSVLCLGLIFGSLFIFKKPRSVASYSYYESLRIAPASLNGNSIWGAGETFETIIDAGGLDDWAAFYSASNKHSGGLDSSGTLSIDGVPYQFSWTGASDFSGNDTIRLYSGHESATITLDTIGAYEKLYVLGTAGGPGEGNYANFAVIVHYTDGTSDETSYRLYDWYDATPVTGVYKWPGIARRVIHGSTHAYEGSSSQAPYLQSATISVNAKKLVSSIDLVLTGRNGQSSTSGIFCGIYAVTGMVNVAAPAPVEVINVDSVTETTANVYWESVLRATSYRLDLALDSEFKNILPNYNNLYTQNLSLVAENLTGDTTYYARVRAENSEGQSISSNVVKFTTEPSTAVAVEANDTTEIDDNYVSDEESAPVETPAEVVNDSEAIRANTFPTISVTAETEKWLAIDFAGVSATDDYGINKLEVSKDGGTTWTLITELESGVYDVTENGTYLFRATNEFGNTATETVVYHNIDSIKPIVAVNSHGYNLGTWTNQPVALSAHNIAGNISPVTLYYRTDGITDGDSDWQLYTEPQAVTNDTNSKIYEFKAVSATGLESDIVRAEVKKDSIVPTGEITEGENSLNVVLNTLTFGLLFNETKTYEMSATDDRSGIKTIEYIISESALDATALQNSSDWRTTDGTVSVNPDQSVNVYYRLTDRAGNVTVISLSGVVFDLPGLSTADIIAETFIEDYENTVAAAEETAAKIKIIAESSGNIPPLKLVTSRDEEAVQALIAAIEETEMSSSDYLTAEEKQALNDALDSLNQRLIIIESTKQSLANIDERIASYHLETVNQDDLNALVELKTEIEDLKTSTHIIAAEKEHLNELLERIEELEKRIEEVEKALEEVTQNDHTGNITPGNVTPEDQTALEDALNGYTHALGVFDSNLPLSSLFEINNRISTINSALDILDQVAEFEKLVAQLPNPADVSFSSRAAIKAAEELYNALSEYGRTLVGPSLSAKYRAVLDAYQAYLESSPLLYAFETLDVFWWGLTTFVITGIFIMVTRRTHRRYIESEEFNDDF